VSMTPDRWQQIKVVLQDALELPEQQRSGFLAEVCSGDPALRQEVESFLALQDEEVSTGILESSASRVALTAGTMLGDYEVLSLLGVGGMGEVYRARDPRLRREVAIKILPSFVSNDPDRLRRFEQEAWAAAALNHPNILAVHQLGTYNGAPYLVSELLEGGTLREHLLRGPMPVRKAIDYSVQIARGLAAAHEKGVVHRDLKPENLFITNDGRAKILDFGLAKLTQRHWALDGSATATEGTEPGVVMGTVGYMSPEQVSGKPADHRADIFALGAIMYEELTGKRAFQKPTAAETMSAILNEDPPTASQFVRTMAPALQKMVHRCLDKNPAQRFQTASDLAFALEALSDSGVQSPITPAPPEQPLRKRKWWYAILTAIALLALVIGTVLFLRTSHKAPEPTLTAVPLTTYPGFQFDPSFSPDGNQIAFGWNGYKLDNFDVYVKLIGTSGPPLRLTTDALQDYSPAWSPDGRFIAFIREFGEKRGVILIPALGGPERKIAEIDMNPGLELPGPYLAWSPDGNSLVISDRDSLTGPFSLFLLLIATSEKRRLTSSPATFLGDSSPAFSPDGRTLAFSRRVDFGLGDLYVLNLLATSEGFKPAGEVERVTFENRAARSPAWTSDGREIVFSDRLGLWRVPPSAHAQPRKITSVGEPVAGQEAVTLTVSRHGQRLIYEHTIFHSNISRLIAPIVDGKWDRGHGIESYRSAVPFISSTRDDEAPQYSRDGKKIAFMSNRSGNPEIWSCDSDGLNALQLTSFGGPQVTTPGWSPDGARIAFDSDAEGEYDIWVIGADGGRPQRMTTHPANDGNPSWSRDGRWIYFDSARTGKQQVWKLPANGGEPIQITRDGGFAPLESPDGKFIYYLKRLEDTNVWRIPIEGGQATMVLEDLSNYRNLAILESGLVFVPNRNTSSLQFLGFATGKITPLANFDRPIAFNAQGGLAVAPDGRSILYTQFEQAGSELMLVENFR
jgi:eukaryotic-like serine/threonine-protein kinase